MLINEVCKRCKLTKKAIEYYEEQKLIFPTIMENGYRDFSQDDVELLKKIATLRKLGLSVSDIQKVLSDHSGAMLNKLLSQKELEIKYLKERQELTEKLARDNDWDYVNVQLETIEKKQSVLQRLLDVFPGYYGKYISLHFAAYLNEPILTDEQHEAFETIIKFLDNIDFDIPTDLQEYLNEATKDFDENFVANIHDNFAKVTQDTEKYILDNQEVLEHYMSFRQSEEFRNSPAYRLQELLKKFNSDSGYNDIFIPAMRKLSKSYQDYFVAMEQANKAFIEKYPQAT
ncbi:MAG: MerR family transcriptional regulator [Tissierellaceae bacterium]|jgi:DNA-binding transcriptional MerR regulator|nr:MerR family transcriptional regulator [Tissierellaceae bacterium]